MIDPDFAVWGQVTGLAELVAVSQCSGSAQVVLHLAGVGESCRVAAHDSESSYLTCVELVLIEYFHFDSALVNLTCNDGAFPSSRKGKHEKPVGCGLQLPFLWHFYSQGSGDWVHRSSSLCFLLENIAAFSCLLELISLEGINCLLII